MPDFPLPFVKMSGTGNDFIIIDNRAGLVRPEEMPSLAASVCQRRNSVGADGLILIEGDPELDFSWRFFNADGSEPNMCGNGSRCAARFAFLEGIAKEKMTFRTLAGPIAAEVHGASVRVQLTPAHSLEARFTLEVEGRAWDAGFVNTGVPHAVLLPSPGELDRLVLEDLGRKVRFHPRFGVSGANADFAETADRHTIRMRTYERGVEGETLACGTGAVAASVVLAARGAVDSPVTVVTRGGERLRVSLDDRDPAGGRLRLEGAARLICRGHLMEEGVPR
jgi:diaminopimelate epimerase